MPVNESLRAVLDKEWENKSLKEILQASPSVLQGVSENDAVNLQQAFNIKTVADLATNKFFLWAQAIHALASAEKL
ncbi:MAG: hypothetical protein KQJ78_17510 [Deltaproteobacteria bacterium]|nr:hypothetical protein [Deltaproteobacteria bacterium]